MKKLMFALIGLVLVMSACVDFEEVIPEVINTSGYSLKLNGVLANTKDTVKYEMNQMVLVEVADATGKKVTAEVNFGNGNAAIVADNAADKYAMAGTYKLTATILNLTPAVKLTANVLIKKKAVDPAKGENVVIVLDSAYVNGVNTITYGLRLDINALDNSAIFVDASVPGKEWSTYTNATEIIVKNGFKYVKWQVVCGNGTIRVGWYQYHTVNGLKTKEWGATSTSKFYNSGLPEFSVYNGGTYKLGTVPNSTVYTLNVNNQVVANGGTVKINEGGSVVFKVLNSAGVAVMSKFSSTGSSDVIADSKTVVYATTGNYVMNMETQADATALNVKIEVVKANVPVYTLNVNNQVVASGGTVKVNEGGSVVFKVLNSAGVAVMTKFSSTGVSDVVADSKTVVYSTAGTYTMNMETQADATAFNVKIEVVKAGTAVYTLKINNETITNGATVKTMEGTMLPFKVLDATGKAVLAKFSFGEGTVVTSDGRSMSYATAGNYQFQAEVDGTIIKATIEVAKIANQVYILKVNNQVVANGATLKMVEGTSTYFKVVNESGAAVVAAYAFGDNTTETTDIAAKIYVAGTYKVTITIGTTVLTVNLEVTKAVTPTYTLKINNEAVSNMSTVKTTEGASLAFKVVNAAGISVVAKFTFGEGTVTTSDGRSIVYATAGNYQAQAEVDGVVIKVNIEVTKAVTPTYTLKVNNNSVANGSTVQTTAGTSVYFKVVDAAGVATVAKYDFGNNTSETTDIAAKSYTAGTYKVTATVGAVTLSVYMEVSGIVQPPVYSFRINGLAISGTISLVEGALTTIKVVNADGKTFTAAMDLGNGTKITTDNASVTYLAGTYKLSATLDGQTISQNIEVTKSIIPPTKPEAVILISSSVSGSTINAILGLRCDAINNVSFTKDTYVAGEIPGKDWTDYKLTETIVIDGVKYFKWAVSAPAGKYRFGWLQMKDGGTNLYKDGSWSNDLNSAFFKEGLFVLYLRVDNNIVKLTAN